MINLLQQLALFSLSKGILMGILVSTIWHVTYIPVIVTCLIFIAVLFYTFLRDFDDLREKK